MSFASRLAPLLVAPVLLGAGAGSPKAPAAKFGADVSVVEVEVPVHVVAKNGEPVRGLAASAFHVFDDGKERPLSSFEVVDYSVESMGSAGLTSRTVTLPPAARRNVLFLFDLSFSSPGEIVRARTAARDVVLSKLEPDDLAAVAVYTVEHGPRLLVTFTPDRAQVARALDSLSFESRDVKQANVDPLRFLVAPPGGPASVATPPGGRSGQGVEIRAELQQAEAETQQVLAKVAQRESELYERSRITTWMRDLGALGRMLDAVRGRKEIVLFTEGFDSRLVLGRSNTADPDETEENQDLLDGAIWQVDLDNRFGNTGLMTEMHHMVDELRRADCAIETVDIAGLRAGGEVRDNGRDPGRDALFAMANETSGKFFENENDLGHDLEAMLERTEVTYVLRFAAKGIKADGAYHRLRVAVDGARGADLSYRDGYYSPRPYPEMHPFEKSLLAADAIAVAQPRQDLPLAVLAAPFRSGDRAYVPVVLELDGKALAAGAADKLDLELYAYATDDHGEVKSFFARTLELNLGKVGGALAGSGLKYYGHLELAPGKYLLRVLAREDTTGHMGVVTQPLEVPDFTTAKAVLLPPFVVDRADRWLLVRERTTEDAKGSVTYPFTVGGEPYVPAAAPEVGTSGARLCLVGYNLPAGELEIAAQLIGGDGKSAGAPRLSIARSPSGVAGLEKWVATLSTEGVAAGKYRLRMEVKGKGSEEAVAAETPIRIVG